MPFEKIPTIEKESKKQKKTKSEPDKSLAQVLEMARKRRKAERVKLSPDEDKRLFLILTKAIKAEKAGDLAKAIEYYSEYKEELLKIKEANKEKERLKEGFEVDVTEYFEFGVPGKPVPDNGGIVFLANEKGLHYLINDKNEKIGNPIVDASEMHKPVKAKGDYWCIVKPRIGEDEPGIVNINTREKITFWNKRFDPPAPHEPERILSINDNVYVVVEAGMGSGELVDLDDNRVLFNGEYHQVSPPLFKTWDIIEGEQKEFLIDEKDNERSKKYDRINQLVEAQGEIYLSVQEKKKRVIGKPKQTESVVDLKGKRIGKKYEMVQKLKEINGKPMFSVCNKGKYFLVDHNGKRVSKKTRDVIWNFEVIGDTTYLITTAKHGTGSQTVTISNNKRGKISEFESAPIESAVNIGGKLYVACKKMFGFGSIVRYGRYIVDENGKDIVDGAKFDPVEIHNFNNKFYCHAKDKEERRAVILDDKGQVLAAMANIFYVKQDEDGRVYIIGREKRGDKFYYVKRFIDLD